MTMHRTLGRPAVVLLVEDNPDDVELTRLGFARAKLDVNLLHVENGEECMRMLRKEGEYADAPTPDLVLLDLNLPVMDGREVLAEIVRDEALRALPVVVLSTSSDARDVQHVYRLRCSSYITKPVDFADFQRVVDQIKSYWFSLVVLPSTNGGVQPGQVSKDATPDIGTNGALAEDATAPRQA